MDIDEKYMTEALKEAQLAFEEDEIPIGALLGEDSGLNLCLGVEQGRGVQ